VSGSERPMNPERDAGRATGKGRRPGVGASDSPPASSAATTKSAPAKRRRPPMGGALLARRKQPGQFLRRKISEQGHPPRRRLWNRLRWSRLGRKLLHRGT
jgi:hypothetical protein